MKHLVTVLSLFILSARPGAAAEPGFFMGSGAWIEALDIVNDPALEEDDAYIEKNFDGDWEAARGYALRILRTAQSRGGTPRLAGVASALGRARIRFMPNTYKTCRPEARNTGFVKSTKGTTIYVCQGSENEPIGAKAQFLIHESSHLAGMKNECDATRMEIEAMTLGAGAPADRNGYADRCGL